MEIIIWLIEAIIFCWLFWLPMSIAKYRGLSDGDLKTIKILSWAGLLVVVTWVIALILAVTYKPKNNQALSGTNNLETLNRLSNLRDKEVITEKEFDAEKRKLLKNI